MPQAPPARFSAMKRKLSEISNDGVSPVIATLLLVALTIILCGIVAAISMPFINQLDEQPPEILAIESVNHYNNAGSYEKSSNITVKNIGREFLWNSAYRPEFYVNNVKQVVEVSKLNARGRGTTGVGRITGDGPNGDVWAPGAIGYFDLTDKMIYPGVTLQVDIIRNSDGKLFSRSIKYIE